MPVIEVMCEYCCKFIMKRSNRIGKHIYCDRECFKAISKITMPCDECGKEINFCKSLLRDHNFCGKQCFNRWNSKRFTASNPEWNKTKMTFEVRSKLRSAKLGTGEGKTYTKTFSRHTHRIVAEEMLGRLLKPGEVVHHEDENKRNNDPSNLRVFPSQAEHARYHCLKKAQYAKQK